MEPLRELGKTLLFLAGLLAVVGGFFISEESYRSGWAACRAT